MKQSKYGDSEIVSILNEAEIGTAVKEICHKNGISSGCYYEWKSKFGDLGVSGFRRIKELEAENAKLKRLYADSALENVALTETICPDIWIPKLYNRNVKTKVVRLAGGIRRLYDKRFIWTSQGHTTYTGIPILFVSYSGSLVRSRLCAALPA